MHELKLALRDELFERVAKSKDFALPVSSDEIPSSPSAVKLGGTRLGASEDLRCCVVVGALRPGMNSGANSGENPPRWVAAFCLDIVGHTQVRYTGRDPFVALCCEDRRDALPRVRGVVLCVAVGTPGSELPGCSARPLSRTFWCAAACCRFARLWASGGCAVVRACVRSACSNRSLLPVGGFSARSRAI